MIELKGKNHMRKIYSNVDWEDYLDDARDYINGNETEDDLNDMAMQMCADDWDYFYQPILEKYFKEHYCIATGSIGRWNGTYYGGTVIESYRDFQDLLEDCWYIYLYDNNGFLTVRGVHHDGEVIFTIRELNEHGVNWYLDHKDDGPIINYLESNFNSKKPSIDWCL